MSRTICTTTDTKIVPREIGQSDQWYMVMKVQGVSTEHLLFSPVDEPGKYLYLHAPDSGPKSWLDRWSSTPQDAKLWEATIAEGEKYPSNENTISTWQSASAFCLEAATTEIATEMGVGI